MVALSVAGEHQPGEIGDQQQPRDAAQPQELAGRSGGDRGHRPDDHLREADVVTGEEDRRPGEVQRQLDEEQGQRGLPPRRGGSARIIATEMPSRA